MASYIAFEVPGLIQPHLPEYCRPENDFLFKLSSTFHTCVPTRLAFISTLLGSLSIVAWLFAQLPQIWKNYTLHSTSGLSIWFLGEWLLGDLSNLLGSIFTRQATWQIVLACYYCFVDVILVMQWFWYEQLKHGRPLRSIWSGRRAKRNDDQLSEPTKPAPLATKAETMPEMDQTKLIPKPSAPRTIFRTPTYASAPASPSGSDPPSLSNTPSNRMVTRVRMGASPMPSPRTVLFISMVLAVLAQGSPLTPDGVATLNSSPASTARAISDSSATELAGRLLSWLSTLSYLLSRLPQLYKNHVRRSTSGLSATLFIAAFTGNLFYSTSLLTNPCAWFTFGPNGGRGWAGSSGSNRGEWLALAAPFFFGAAGVLLMDAMMGLQFWIFSSNSVLGKGPTDDEVIVIVDDEGLDSDRFANRPGQGWQWRRVSGFMRGWVPSVSVAGTPRPETPAGGYFEGARVGGNHHGEGGAAEGRSLLADYDRATGYGAVGGSSPPGR